VVRANQKGDAMTTKVFYRFALDPFALIDVVQMLRHGEIDRALTYAKAKMQKIGPLECVDDGDDEADTGDVDEPFNSPGTNTPKL
jgi:hypothetical protein